MQEVNAACERLTQGDGGCLCRRLITLLGIGKMDSCGCVEVDYELVTDRKMTILNALSGPHGPTILKILEARQT